MGMAAYGKDNYDLSDLLYFNSEKGVVDANYPETFNDFDDYSSITQPVYNEDYIFNLTKVKRPVYSSKGFEQEHFDLAASVQMQFSNTYIDLIKYWLGVTNQKYLCLSGGCVLNCLANKELLGDELENIYVMPAASDRGLSLGSAMYTAGLNQEKIYSVDNMYLGRSFTKENIIETLNNCGINYEEVKNHTNDCAQLLKKGYVIGWFQGRSEFGPRALGHRSILANPQTTGMKDTLNKKIKFRESYRPFAPAILQEDFDKYYESKIDFSYMTFTVDVPPDLAKLIPEAVHFDGTARVQTVKQQSDSNFYELLSEIKKVNGIGAVINTSLNLANEPIVDSPSDAIRTFFSSGIDVLYMENIKLVKSKDIN
jgi:carbamoyltransferase